MAGLLGVKACSTHCNSDDSPGVLGSSIFSSPFSKEVAASGWLREAWLTPAIPALGEAESEGCKSVASLASIASSRLTWNLNQLVNKKVNKKFKVSFQITFKVYRLTVPLHNRSSSLMTCCL